MDPSTDTASLRAQIATLQAELDSLRARYDTLLEAKNRAAEHYKADYKKWRDFKRWLFRDAETDGHVKPLLKGGELAPCTRASALGKRKRLEESGLNFGHAGNEDHETKSLKQESVNLECPHSPSVAVASRRQRRKSYHGGSPRKVLSLSPNDDKDSFPAPQSTSHDDKSSVSVNKAGMSRKTEPPRSIPSTEPRKGRGRYAQVASGMHTINARFSIRTDKNDGADFQYDAVVRNREERKRMLGGDCECCREYYEAVGPLPGSRQPLWRTPTKHKARHLHASDDKENADEAEEHKQLVSRHRHHWHGPKTPPGYWDIGFPDTQEVLDINRRAAEMHKRKLVDVEAEARHSNGRYVERAPRTP